MEDLIHPTTAPGRGGALLSKGIAVSFVLVLGSTALVDRLWPIEAPRLVGQEKAEYAATQRERNLRDGSFARWIEKETATRSRTRVSLGPWWSIVMLKLGDSIKKDLVTGEGGWLFLRRRAEFDPKTLREAPAVATNTLLALRRRLALHGCDLRFLPIPRKAAAGSERLPVGFPAHREFDAEVISRLRAGGAPTIDLLRAWGGMDADDLYMRLDTHWEVGGQEAAARAIADQFEDLRARPGEGIGAVELVRTEEPGPGALLRFAGFYKGYSAWHHVNDAPLNRVRLASEALEQKLAGPGAIGGERSEVVLAGTSFTQHLALHPLVVSELRAPVVKVASDGAAFTEPIEWLLKRWSREPSLPRVVILEFPIFQVADALNRRTGVTRAIGSIVGRLDLGDVAVRALLPTPSYRDAEPGRKGPQLRAVLPPGSTLTSGDGVVQLRVEVHSEAPTQWNVRTAAMDVPVHFDAGGGVAWVPLIEGVDWSGRVQVFSTDRGSHAASITIEPVCPETQSFELEGTKVAAMEPLPSSSFTDLDTEILPKDVLLVDWSEGKHAPQPTADVCLSLRGSTGASDTHAYWLFPDAVGRSAVISLAAFEGGKLDGVQLQGVGADVTLRLIRAEPRR